MCNLSYSKTNGTCIRSLEMFCVVRAGAGEVASVCSAALLACEAVLHPRGAVAAPSEGGGGEDGASAVATGSAGRAHAHARDVWSDMDALLRSNPAAMLASASAAATSMLEPWTHKHPRNR